MVVSACKKIMAETNNTEEKLEEVSLLQSVNRGDKTVKQVDWETFLSNVVKLVGQMTHPISPIAWAWAFINEIDDYTLRMDVLSAWIDVAPKCFPTQEDSDSFIEDCHCLIRICMKLRGVLLNGQAPLPHTYDRVELGGRGLNELAMIWSESVITGSDMIALAAAICDLSEDGNVAPQIDYFLYSFRDLPKLPFDNCYDFSRFLFLAEIFRQYLVEGKMYTDEPMTFGDFKRRLRNACFEEYIRLRKIEIEKKLDDDNWQLLDPTDEECYNELYKQESSVFNREISFEDFRGSKAYSDRYFSGRQDVLHMMRYFMKYLEWKMENLNEDTMSKNKPTQIINGDYVAGNKYTGTVIEKVEAGGIGVQENYGSQKPQRPAAASTNTEKREAVPFEPVNVTFTKNRTQTYNIVALYQDLLKEGWIEEGDPDDFCALFEGKPTDCRIVWTKKVGKDNLYALFKMMVDNNFISVPGGYGLQRIIESHFVYKNGEYVTGIDSAKPSDSARTLITSWRKLLEAKVNFDD